MNNETIRIARELIRIAAELADPGQADAAISMPSSISEVGSISGAIEGVLPNAHDDDEPWLYDSAKGCCWDYVDTELSAVDFSDQDVFRFLNERDANGAPKYRFVYAINVRECNEHWSGRSSDYSPSYDTGFFPCGDDLAVFASVEDKYDGNSTHRYNIGGAIAGTAFSRIGEKVKSLSYDASEVSQGTGHLDDDF